MGTFLKINLSFDLDKVLLHFPILGQYLFMNAICFFNSCWVRPDMVIYFRVIPGSLIMLVNLCIFIVVVYTNVTRKPPGIPKQQAVDGCYFLISIVFLKVSLLVKAEFLALSNKFGSLKLMSALNQMKKWALRTFKANSHWRRDCVT